MSTTIAGHELTAVQQQTLDDLLAYMREHAGDTGISATTSPLGNGREVSLRDEVFPGHNNVMKAKRTTVNRLNDKGVLRACEIVLDHGMLKWVPL